MANDLRLRVLLDAIDKASAPLKQISKGSLKTARELKAARDRLKELNAQQKDVSAWRTQITQSRQTGQALDAARAKVRAITQEMAATGAPTKSMASSMRTAVREAQRLKTEHQQQAEKLQLLRTKLHGAGISTRDLGNHERTLREQIGATNKAISTQSRRMDELASRQAKLAKARAHLEKAQSQSAKLAGMGVAGIAGGSGALYAGARMIGAGVQFDSDMSKVQALTRLDKQSPELAALRAQARQLGAETMFSATDAAQGQGYLAMAGFDPKSIREAMPGMLDLAKAGDTGLAETSDIASNILTGMNLKAADMGRLGDVLVGTFTRSNTNLAMLGETMKYVAPVASSVGQDIETVAAMAGKLGDAGIQGSMGGTALRAILGRLSAPPKSAAKALEQLGVKGKDAQGNLRDMPSILKEIYEKTRKMGSADRAGILKDIAGDEAVAGMQVLVAQAGTGQLQSFIQTLKKTQGEAQRTAKIMGDNLTGDLDELSSAWEDLGIQLEEQQDGPLRSIVQTLAQVVGSIKGWIVENPALSSGIVKAAAGIAVLVAAMGGLTLALASILGPFAMVRFGMALFTVKSAGMFAVVGKLISVLSGGLLTAIRTVSIALWGLAMNPVAFAITAVVAALAGAAYLIYQNWDQVKAYFTNAWAEIRSDFDRGVGGILNILGNFNPVGLVYQAFAAVMNYLGFELPTRFTEFGNMIVNGLVNGLMSGLGQIKDAVSALGDSTIGWFKEKLGIHSPSRVFAELGGFTTEGLAMGLDDGVKAPLEAVNRMGQQLTNAGTFAFKGTLREFNGGGPLAAGGTPITMDDRAPLGAAPSASYYSHDIYEINIHPSPGMDPQAIGRAVRAELARINSEKAARQRSRLTDQE
ncbi:phage tail tape measure protein [Pseudomonas sp. 2hn]|uniref:phage tail tape measure protein n=1 Tax=Pseudomonas sp. 2hn TaxID=2866626 RepID=UPI001C7D10C4|nr:phage tail tape measure protein [Pseudomonas sp. 2hn]QZA52579.1 phage tail tape measure protein [Pseudomonas sp. 2hn]